MDVSEDFESVFREITESEICLGHSLLYVWYASFLESKGKLHDAHMVYQSGFLRSFSFSVCLCFFSRLELFERVNLCPNTCNVALRLGMPNHLSC